MADSAGAQKTEKPTPKRLADARKKGQIPRSPDLVGWAALLAASFVLPALIGGFRSTLTDYFITINQAVGAGEFELAITEAGGLVTSTALIFAPFMIFMVVITAGGLAIQGGVVLTGDPLKPKLERISPKSGVKRLFSMQSVVDTAKALFRLIVLTILVVVIMTGQLSKHIGGTSRALEPSGIELASSLLFLVRLAGLVGLVIGLGDYAWQRRKIGKQLKMTKDEVRREHRNTEGDPLTRGRRRSMHAKVSQNQMLSAVGEASVVLVNPTHVAVALSYKAGAVPTVVAKGGDVLAARIRERAFEYDVPVVEVRPLARILHDTIDVGNEVPAHLYEAVAIVIAFVMRAPKTAVGGMIRKLNVPNSKLVDSGAAQP